MLSLLQKYGLYAGWDPDNRLYLTDITYILRAYAGLNSKSFIPIYKEQSFESISSAIGKMLCFQDLCNYNTPRVLRIEKHFLTLWHRPQTDEDILV